MGLVTLANLVWFVWGLPLIRTSIGDATVYTEISVRAKSPSSEGPNNHQRGEIFSETRCSLPTAKDMNF